ncbi:MAG: F0F1 ATP synthase subunit B [Nocardioidaceae bacterium]
MSTTVLAAGESNFLVPNATFIAEVIAFVIILLVLAKWVVPPINKAMVDRQERIRKQFDELEQAKADAESAEQEYKSQFSEARHEAARIREEAREQGAQIIAEMRQQAQAEAERITSNAHAQIDVERTQAYQQLRAEVGGVAATLAGRIIGESLDDDERQRRTVERFLQDLEATSSGTATIGSAR